jgi:hypothetical protein
MSIKTFTEQDWAAFWASEALNKQRSQAIAVMPTEEFLTHVDKRIAGKDNPTLFTCEWDRINQTYCNATGNRELNFWQDEPDLDLPQRIALLRRQVAQAMARRLTE